MGWEYTNWLLPAVLALILLSAGIEDARHRTIGNGKNLAIALLAPLWWLSQDLAPWPDMACQLVLAGIVFALFCGAFAIGAMGGGDVKLIGALALAAVPAPDVDADGNEHRRRRPDDPDDDRARDQEDQRSDRSSLRCRDRRRRAAQLTTNVILTSSGDA